MNKRHFENIDASRFIAFIPVFFTHVFFTNSPEIKSSTLYHFVQDHLKVGLLGLDYFFVLSSFLITWIILEEYDQTKKFNIIHFWIRRCLRIWPLYFSVVALGFAAIYINNTFLNGTSHQPPPWYHFIFFTLNFYCAKNGIFFLFFLTIFWSVAIEEQFYLFWALALKFFKKYFLVVSFSLVLISLIFRWAHLNENDNMVFNTFSSLSNFAIGAIVAYIAFKKNSIYHWLLNLSKTTIVLFYIVFLLNVVFYPKIYFTPVFIIFERFIFACFYGFIVFEQCFCKNSLFKLGRSKLVNYLGIMSFGLYCYHAVVITFVRKFVEATGLNTSYTEVFIINPLVIFLITIMCAIISYELFEKKILKLKNRFYTVSK